ncbi:MAG: hypothetical protein IJG30_05235 [Synergistaceae bacterium]|nr:hypothetical protein [Synergistaceae bacterium]
MNEIAFTLFCGCTICLTLQVGIAIYTFKVLEKIKDFMDFAWDFMEQKLLDREYQRGRKEAIAEFDQNYLQEGTD